MRISVWQLSTVILLSVLIGQNLPTRPREAQAASKDVFGSPQVAVSSYKNQKGSFILWADGHISSADAPNTVISKSDECVIASVPQITRDNSKPQGSPHVPVGVYQNSTATYVLFSDGVLQTPKGDAAAPSANPGVRQATCNGFSMTVSGDDSIKMRGAGRPGHYTITFDPPFTNTPAVTVTDTQEPHIAGIMPNTLSKNGCEVWTSDTGGRFYNEIFCITAVGE